MGHVVALAMPHYGDVKFEAAEAFRRPTDPERSSVRAIIRLGNPGSLLTSNFNRAWCAALNLRAGHGVTHFAMLHADVAAAPGWLDLLLGELERHQADVVSAVIPLKTEHGLTSTAVGTPNKYLQRRLTMSEIHRLPETFDAGHVAETLGFMGPLLVNTGCWVCDLRKPWCDEVDAEGRLKWAFRVENDIVRDPATGHFKSFVASEDWLFSRHLGGIGARVYATRNIPAYHIGTHNYVNGKPWGTWETDEAFAGVERELSAREK